MSVDADDARGLVELLEAIDEGGGDVRDIWLDTMGGTFALEVAVSGSREATDKDVESSAAEMNTSACSCGPDQACHICGGDRA